MSLNCKRLIAAFALCAALGVLSVPAFAQTTEPVVAGSWNVTFFIRPGLSTGATQCIVFTYTGGVSGQPASGTFTSPTFPGWLGNWIQVGDQVQWYGFTGNGTLATGDFGPVINKDLMSGSFNDYVPPAGSTSSTGTYIAVRTSTCIPPPTPPTSADPAKN